MLLHIRQFLVQQNAEVTNNTGWLNGCGTDGQRTINVGNLGKSKNSRKYAVFETRCMSAYYVCDHLITLHKLLSVMWTLGL